MKPALLCLLTICAFAQPPEPQVWNRVFSADGQKLTPLPYEKVKQSGKKDHREAAIDGPQSSQRFKQGSDPILVIAYSAGNVPTSAARLYRMSKDTNSRRVPLGVWAVTSGPQTQPGAVPLKMENYGKLSKRLIVPPNLAPGEYAISNPSGSFAFTFGVD